MAVESPQVNDEREYVVQMRGSITVEELRQALDEVNEETQISSFQIGFTVDDKAPISLLPQGVEREVKALGEGEITPEMEVGEDTTADTETPEDQIGADEIPDDPTIEDIDIENDEKYKYQAIQRVAPKYGIKGNLPREEMVEQLKEVSPGDEIQEDEEEAGDESDGESIEDVDVPEDPVPEDLDLENEEKYEYQTLQKAAGNADADIKGNQKREPLVEALKEYVEESSSDEDEGGETDVTVTIRAGHDPYYLMRIIDEADGWIVTNRIRESIPDEWDVNEETIGNTLWKLTDDGLLEKQQHEHDKRKNEYRVTSAGEDVLQDAMQGADDDTSPSVAAAT